MKRPLFTIGSSYFLATVAAVVLGASAALAAGALCLFWSGLALFLYEREKADKVVLPLLSACAACVLFFAYSQLYLQPLALPKGTQLPMEGVALSVCREEWGSRISLQANIQPVYPDTVPVQLYVYDRDLEVQAGQTVTAVVRVRESCSNTGNSIGLSRGELLRCTPDSPLAVRETERLTLYQRMMTVRQKLLDACGLLYRGENRQVLEGVLLGEMEGMEPVLLQRLTLSGLRHLTAVSGFHISLMSGIFLTLSRRLRLPPLASGGALLIFLLLTAMAQGLTPSVVRACVMAGMLCISQMVSRQYDALNSLGLAVLVILVPNPMAAVGASFLLSFSAMLGILLFHERLFLAIMALPQVGRRFRFGKKLIPGAAELLAASLSAQIFTLPLQIFYFHRVIVFGVFSTMLASLLMPGMMTLGLASLLLCGLPWTAPARLAAFAADIFLSLFRLIAAGFSLLPNLSFSPGQLYIWALLPLYYLGGWFVLQKKKEWRLPGLLLAFLILFVGEISWKWTEGQTLHIISREEFVLLIQDGQAAVVGNLPDEYAARQVSRLLEENRDAALEILWETAPDNQDNYGAVLLVRQYRPEVTAAPSAGRYTPFLEKAAANGLTDSRQPTVFSLGKGVEAACFPTLEGTMVEIRAGGKNILKSADGCAIIEEMSRQEMIILPDGSFVYQPQRGIVALPGEENHLLLRTGGEQR